MGNLIPAIYNPTTNGIQILDWTDSTTDQNENADWWFLKNILYFLKFSQLFAVIF